MTFDRNSCLDCIEPPNAILNIPPPPLPSFLLPKSADALIIGSNNSACFAANMCEPTSGQSDHIEFIEIRNANLGIEEPWFYVLISILCIVLLLGTIFAIILLKCRDSNCSYQSNIKHQMQFTRERDSNGNNKHNVYGVGNGQLVPAYNPPLPVLWATLTPNGTAQHYIGTSEPYPQEDHYEAVDYNRKAYQACVNDLNKSFTTPKKNITLNPNKTQFENNGFNDYEDYVDPSPLIAGSFGNLDNEEDSGISGEYQDPHQFSSNGSSNGEFYPSNASISSNQYRSSAVSSMNRQRMISIPTRINNPNVVIPPLNSRTLAKNIKNATLHNNHHQHQQQQQQSSPVYNKRISTTLNLNRRFSENQ